MPGRFRGHVRAPLVSALVVCSLALAACASRGTVTPQHPATGSSHSTTVPTARPDKGVTAAGVGTATIWRVKAGQLSVSTSHGQWSAVSLPEGISPSKVSAITTAANAVFLASPDSGSSFSVYHHVSGAAKWSHSVLTPSWPSIATGATQGSVRISTSNGSLVVVTDSVSLGTSHSATRVFISKNGGQTFVQSSPARAADIELRWDYSTFASATSGVVVAGPAATFVYATADGGQTWSQSTLPVLPEVVYGQPVVNGSSYEIPVTSKSGNGNEQFGIAASVDGGRTFSLTGANVDLATQMQDSPAVAASSGNVWWVVSSEGGQKLYKTSDDGATWTNLLMSGFPGGGTMTFTSGPSNAAPGTAAPSTVMPTRSGTPGTSAPASSQTTQPPASGQMYATDVVTSTQCVHQTNCVTSTVIASTSDGGITWVSTQ